MASPLNVLLICVVYFAYFLCATEIPRKTANVQDVSITVCTTEPCPLKKTTFIWFNMTFVPDDDYAKVKVSVTGMLMGVKTGWVGIDGQDGCKFITPPCPLKKGETYLYANEAEIKKIFPKVSLLMHYALRSDKGKEIAGYDVQVKVV